MSAEQQICHSLTNSLKGLIHPVYCRNAEKAKKKAPFILGPLAALGTPKGRIRRPAALGSLMPLTVEADQAPADGVLGQFGYATEMEFVHQIRPMGPNRFFSLMHNRSAISRLE